MHMIVSDTPKRSNNEPFTIAFLERGDILDICRNMHNHAECYQLCMLHYAVGKSLKISWGLHVPLVPLTGDTPGSGDWYISREVKL